MPRNIEIKARLRDADAVRARASKLAGEGPQRLVQRDTFFRSASGRLKLREFEGGSAELIYYERPDSAGPKRSTYVRAPVADVRSMLELLTACAGVRAVINKTRDVYLVGETRIHIDNVENLGRFVEIEVVLSPASSEEDGHARACELMQVLGIDESDLVREAYVDLMGRRERSSRGVAEVKSAAASRAGDE